MAAMAQHSGDRGLHKLCANIFRAEITAEGGCDKILETLKNNYSKGGIQEATTLWRDRLRNISRRPGEGNRSWVNRVHNVASKTGAALQALDNSIDADASMHPLVIGMMFLGSVACR